MNRSLIHFLLYFYFNHSLITRAQICSLPNNLIPNHSLLNDQPLIDRSPDRSLDPTHLVLGILLPNLLPDSSIARNDPIFINIDP